MATEEKKTEDVEKVLADMKAVVEKEFAEKLAKLGYRANSGKSKRSRQKIGARCGRHAEKRKPRLDERELVNALAFFPR